MLRIFKVSKFSSILSVVAVFVSMVAIADPSKMMNRSATQPDNSAVNQRDVGQNQALPTADQQARTSKSDVEITRQIRRELTKSSDLSVYAKNVKIITENGTVTLRGPVHSEAESNRVSAIAGKVVGTTSVQNQLEVKM